MYVFHTGVEYSEHNTILQTVSNVSKSHIFVTIFRFSKEKWYSNDDNWATTSEFHALSVEDLMAHNWQK